MGAVCVCFFFKQKTAYELRISDWSSDVCSSDLLKTLLNQTPLLRNLGLRARDGGAGFCGRRPGYRYCPLSWILSYSGLWHFSGGKIGRASCRERVSVRVDLGGRRLINKKSKTESQQKD